MINCSTDISDQQTDDRRSTRELSAAPLFRKEAVEARTSKRLPAVVRVRAPYLTPAALFALAIVSGLLALCIYGRLTQLVSASGSLVPAKSSLKIYSPKNGIVESIDVVQGQSVKFGQPLFSVSAEQYGSDSTPLLKRATLMIRDHIAEITKTETLVRQQSKEQEDVLNDEIAIAVNQLHLTNQSIELAQSSVNRNIQILSRKSGLRESDIISITEIEKAQEALATGQQRLLALMTDKQAVQKSLSEYQSEKIQLPTRLDLKISEFEQQIATAEVELAKNEMLREVVVQAPADGTIAATQAYVGQRVTTDRPVLVVNPANSSLIAQLLVPSSGIGFIHPGSRVSIKYDAFPYQTFGYSTGTITDIGDVALPASEVQMLKIQGRRSDPVFNVLADIDSQDIETYGHKTPLLAGSTFTATMSGETRYIWQWIFNPLLSVRGDAFSGPAR